MKLLFLAGIIAAAEPVRPVIVHLIDNAGVPMERIQPASAIVMEIFKGIGVKIEWRLYRPTDGSAIEITLRDSTPHDLMPRAMAYAYPYEGVRIVVFYDRILRRGAPTHVLAHVMAHEIGHVLEGSDGHSGDGIMKASWSADDYGAMRLGQLVFAPSDAELIRKGVAARAQKPMMAGSGKVPSGKE